VAADPDGDPLTYSWTASGGTVKPVNEDGSEGLWTAPDVTGSYQVTCTVDDGKGGTDSSALELVVASPRSLVAHYPFSGSALDQSGNARHGTVGGPVLAPDRFGGANSAYSFDGIDDHIDLGPDEALKFTSSFSICAWIRVDDFAYPTGWGTIFGNNRGDYDPYHAYMLTVDSQGLDFNLRNTDKVNHQVRLSAESLQAGTWSMVTAVYDHGNQTWSGYLNGEFFLSAAFEGQLVNVGVFRSTIGAGYGGALGYGSAFRGDIDDVRIYGRTLSQAEIVALFHEGGY